MPSQAHVPLPPKEPAEALSRTVTCRAASYTTLEVNQGAWGPFVLDLRPGVTVPFPCIEHVAAGLGAAEQDRDIPR
jgi:hypothetical protein